MSLSTSELIAAVKRHLSTIGKRARDKEGKNIFSDITLSSAEDTQLLTQYIKAAIHDIEALLKPLITSTTEQGGAFTITITNTRGDQDFQSRVEDMQKSFIILSVTASYFSMLHPEYAEKYHNEAQQAMTALIKYAFHKDAPASVGYSYGDKRGGTFLPSSVVISDFTFSNIDMQQGVSPTTTVEPQDATLHFSSSDTGIFSVDESSGHITPTGVLGDAYLSARFYGNDYYTPSSDSVKVSLTQNDVILSINQSLCDHDLRNEYDDYIPSDAASRLVFKLPLTNGEAFNLFRVMGSRITLFKYELIQSVYEEGELYQRSMVYKSDSAMTLGSIKEEIMRGVTSHSYDLIYLWVPNIVDDGKLELDEIEVQYDIIGTHE